MVSTPAAPAEETDAARQLRLSLLAAVLFFANPIALTLANFWERIVSDLLPALLFLQLEGVYVVLALVTGGAIIRKRPIVWLWLIPVVLAALLISAQIGFNLSRRFAEGGREHCSRRKRNGGGSGDEAKPRRTSRSSRPGRDAG